MTIILNAENLIELQKERKITLVKKYQKNSDDYNFYINPNIGIKLYSAKVIDISLNHIVFEYNKKDSLNLFILLKLINENLLNLYKQSDSYDSKTIYNLYIDKEDTFTIRCYLPHNKFKYFISHYESNIQKPFNLPKKKGVYDEVYIDIRNLWIKDNKVGFNLELKQTNLF